MWMARACSQPWLSCVVGLMSLVLAMMPVRACDMRSSPASLCAGMPCVCNTLQHTAAHCNTLQHTATRCNTLQHIWCRCAFAICARVRRASAWVCIHICMSHVCRTHIYRWNDSYINVTWLIHICDMTHGYMEHKWYTHMAWLIHICDMTHKCMRHDSYMYVTWLIHICDMIHTCIWHDSNMYVTWLVHMWHDS